MLHVPTIHVARDQNHLAWDPAIPPVATVSSGEIVGFDCLDASNGQLTADSTLADLEALDFSRVDQVIVDMPNVVVTAYCPLGLFD